MLYNRKINSTNLWNNLSNKKKWSRLKKVRWVLAVERGALAKISPKWRSRRRRRCRRDRGLSSILRDYRRGKLDQVHQQAFRISSCRIREEVDSLTCLSSEWDLNRLRSISRSNSKQHKTPNRHNSHKPPQLQQPLRPLSPRLLVRSRLLPRPRLTLKTRLQHKLPRLLKIRKRRKVKNDFMFSIINKYLK